MAVSTTTQTGLICLSDVAWVTYEHLLGDLRDRSTPRMTYDRGTLEIMSPTAEHEELNRTLASIVEIICEELQLDYRNLGSATFRRPDLLRGFEPDSCFYIASLERVKGKTEIDLTADPPPDLVIEIDITSSSLDKLSIFAAVGIPEVWMHDGSSLRIYVLEESHYSEREASEALALIRRSDLMRIVEASRSMRRPEWVRTVRESVRR